MGLFKRKESNNTSTENEITGNGCTVTFHDDYITAKSKFEGTFNIHKNDVIAMSEILKLEYFSDRYFIIATQNFRCKFNFSKKQLSESEKLHDYLKANNPNAKRHIRTIELQYTGGHPSLPQSGASDIDVFENCISIYRPLYSAVLKYENITGIQLETQEQITSRFTATRIALLGPFALAFKKEKKTTEKYLTIDFTDANGMPFTAVFSGDNCKLAHQDIYTAYSKYISSHPKNEDKPTDAYEELKKLKELLDMGIITQEEFEAKKKQLLDRV